MSKQGPISEPVSINWDPVQDMTDCVTPTQSAYLRLLGESEAIFQYRGNNKMSVAVMLTSETLKHRSEGEK